MLDHASFTNTLLFTPSLVAWLQNYDKAFLLFGKAAEQGHAGEPAQRGPRGTTGAA